MLNMSKNKDYLRLMGQTISTTTATPHNNNINSCSLIAGLSTNSIMLNTTETAANNAASKSERESIHSGQFMVSTFEAEEAQDDLEEDAEVKMLDPEDPSLSKPDEPNTCTQVQLYVPRKMAQMQREGGLRDNCATTGIITSHLEIETSLTKLFKCMNLAYR